MRKEEFRSESRIGENSASGLVCEVESTKCNPFRGNHLRSFTLIELLVSLTIFAIIAVAVYSVFSTGIIGWRKGEVAISLFHEIRLSLDRITREVRNKASYNEFKLVGRADELYFIGLVPFPEEGKSEYTRLAKLRYSLEEGENGLNLFRERVWVPSLEEESEEIDKMRLISSIESLDFQYGEKIEEEEEVILTWNPDWVDKEEDPAAIKINFNIGEKESQGLSRVIYLPQGAEL